MQGNCRSFLTDSSGFYSYESVALKRMRQDLTFREIECRDARRQLQECLDREHAAWVWAILLSCMSSSLGFFLGIFWS